MTTQYLFKYIFCYSSVRRPANLDKISAGTWGMAHELGGLYLAVGEIMLYMMMKCLESKKKRHAVATVIRTSMK